ncbi:vegetative cell wall gp1 protein [Rutstroemia sp. NJR-2017a WRK4]|nr:vegetative cell wall gp1 protein [Rutstroemia sp. NJR-2017a WRK4]
MEAAGLVLGVLGVAGLFSACIDSFDIVVRAKDFSEDFDILCTLLVTQRVQFAIWGELVGLVPDGNGRKLPYNKAIDRPDIRLALERTLNNIRLLLQKTDVTVDRYEVEYGSSPSTEVSTSRGMDAFKDQWDSFKTRLRRNQRQTSVTKVTRWAVHDSAQFEKQVSRIKDLVEALYSITGSLDLLEQQQSRLRQEIESISDAQSLRLLRDVASMDHHTSSLIQDVSDTASRRLTFVTKSITGGGTTTDRTGASTAFYSAQSQASARSTASMIDEESHSEYDDGSVEENAGSTNKVAVQEDALATPPVNLPQNQRLLAEILKKADKHKPLSFASGDSRYGQQLAAYKKLDEEFCLRNSARMIAYTSTGTSAAKRMFFELRRIREAGVPFVSAAPIGDDLSRILASIEGPPETPYEGGIFWITVGVSEENPSKPPLLRFHTRVYHPNVDHKGNICADYQERWNALPKSRYVKGAYKDPNSQWFQEKSTGIWSLDALLTALCALLATPDVDDPLVPEIAQMYLENYDNYCAAAKLYTQRYATQSKPDESILVFSDTAEETPSEHSEEELEHDESLEKKLRQFEYTDEANTLESLNSSEAMEGLESWLAKYRKRKTHGNVRDYERKESTHSYAISSNADSYTPNVYEYTVSSNLPNGYDKGHSNKHYYYPPSAGSYYSGVGRHNPDWSYRYTSKYIQEPGTRSFSKLSNLNGYGYPHSNEPARRIPSDIGYTNDERRAQRPRAKRPPLNSNFKPKPSRKSREATKLDARANYIHPGYSLEHWDPAEKPILVLSSVFDADSLGSWIYDWTVYQYGPSTPISDMAGELWLLLIQISVKSKRLDETIPKMRTSDDKDMIEDFAESAERLIGRLKTLLGVAEVHALWEYKEAKLLASSSPRDINRQGDGLRSQTEMPNLDSQSESDTEKFPSAQVGNRDRKLPRKSIEKIRRKQVGNAEDRLNSVLATEIICSLFGIEYQLLNTEKLMAKLRLWNLRFDANCEDVIRRVSTSPNIKRHSQYEEPPPVCPSEAKQIKNSDGLSLEENLNGEVPATIIEVSESDEESEEPMSNAETKASINSNTKVSAMSRSPRVEDEEQKETYQGSDLTGRNQVSKPGTITRAELEPENLFPPIRIRPTAPEPPKKFRDRDHDIITASRDGELKNDQMRNLTRRIPRTEALRLADSTMEFWDKRQLETLAEMTEEED